MLLVKNRTQELSFLIAYIVVLFASAFVRDFLIAPYVTHHISGIGALLVEPLWKLIFWIVPTLLYIQFIERQNPLTYLKLSTNIGKGLLWGLAGILFLVVVLSGSFIRVHTLHFSQSADTWVNVILLVGFMEEIPFRGFLFQKLQSLFGSSWAGITGARIISSLLFALIHTPLWVSTGQSVDFFGLLQVFIIALVLCTVLKMSDSLWSSIIVHTFYDFLSTILQ
jgi:membrane protease YdiL (CAAX protease family)